MTVRTHGAQILDWVDFVLSGDGGQRNNMMHVDYRREFITVYIGKCHLADYAASAIVLKAAPSGLAIALIGVDLNLSDGALAELLPCVHFLGDEVIGSFAGQFSTEECAHIHSARAMRDVKLVIP